MKITVQICSGTACYVMGGAELLSISEHLTPDELEQVDIKGIMCLGLCENYNPNTPYVKIDDEIIKNVTIETLTERIRLAIKAKAEK